MDAAATPPQGDATWCRGSPPTTDSHVRHITYTSLSTTPPSSARQGLTPGRGGGRAHGAGAAMPYAGRSPVRNITYTTTTGSPGGSELSEINISNLTEEAADAVIEIEEAADDACIPAPDVALPAAPPGGLPHTLGAFGPGGAHSPGPLACLNGGGRVGGVAATSASPAAADAHRSPTVRGQRGGPADVGGGDAPSPHRGSSPSAAGPAGGRYMFHTRSAGRPQPPQGGAPRRGPASDAHIGAGGDTDNDNNNTAGHYEAVLSVMEDLQAECQDLKAANDKQQQQLALAAQKERDGAVVMAKLAEELQMRERVVEQLQSMAQQIPGSVQEEVRDLEAKAADYEERYHAAARQVRPLQEKLHQQEKYIKQLEARAAASADVTQQSKSTLSELSIELMRLKQERRVERLHSRRLGERLSEKLEQAQMAAEESRVAMQEELQRRKQLEKGYVQQAQGVLQLKEEQLRLVKDDLAAKDVQLEESRGLIKDMMQNVQENVQKLNRLRSERDALAQELQDAKAVVQELEQRNEAVKDTRKQVRKEVFGVLEKARVTEEAWQKEKVKYDELLAKQRDRAQALAAGRAKLEEAAKEAKQTARKVQDKYDDMLHAVDKACGHICDTPVVPPGVDANDEGDSLLGVLKAAGVHAGGNAKQKLQRMVDRAAKTQQALVSMRAAHQALKREVEEVRMECDDAKSHAAWLEQEWAATKERKARVEDECAKFREEARKAAKASRDVLAENDALADRLARLENGLAAQSDKMTDQRERHSEDLASARAELGVAQEALGTAKAQLAEAREAKEEVACLRQRVRELNDVLETAAEEKAALEESHAALLAEKNQLFDAKSKHQRAAARHVADAKKARAEGEEAQRKLEGSHKASEQLRKQVQQKDAELKALQEKVHTLLEQVEAKQRHARREEARAQGLQEEAAMSKAELERLRECTAGKEEVAALTVQLEDMTRRHAEACGRARELADNLRDVTELHALVEDELNVLRREEERRARVLKERTMATPKRSPNVGERAHQKKQVLHRQNAATGVETPYAVLHGRQPLSAGREPRAGGPPSMHPHPQALSFSPSVVHTPPVHGTPPARGDSPYASSPMPRTGLTKALLACDDPLLDAPDKDGPGKPQQPSGRAAGKSPTYLRQEEVSSVAVIDCCL